MRTTTLRDLSPTVLDRPRWVLSTDFLIGLVLAAGLPAAFWTAAIAGVGAVLGYDLGPMVLVTTGGVIAVFLGIFFAAFAQQKT